MLRRHGHRVAQASGDNMGGEPRRQVGLRRNPWLDFCHIGVKRRYHVEPTAYDASGRLFTQYAQVFDLQSVTKSRRRGNK